MNLIPIGHVPDDLRQTSRGTAFTAVMLFWAAVFAPIHFAMGGAMCTVVLLSGCLLAVGILVAIRLGVPMPICGNALCAAAYYVYTSLALCSGGRWGPSVDWYVTLPVLALVVCGARWAGFWTALTLFSIGVFGALDHLGIRIESEIAPDNLAILRSLGLAGLVLCCHVLAFTMLHFERQSRQALREANHWLQVESAFDALTRVANRRGFDQVFDHEWRRHRREQLPLSLALIDLDFFKEFNDLRGHLAGDAVLRRVAGAIQTGVRRRDDMVARYGGEEFVVVLPNTGEHHASLVVENIRAQVAQLGIAHPRAVVNQIVTISVGTATMIPSNEQTPFDLIRLADEALYRAKAAGRDRAVHASQTVMPQDVLEEALQTANCFGPHGADHNSAATAFDAAHR
ncbi:MAG: GGDEF domain-containing protein [Pirellulales bacterium]|nr:GGDEF domain-containing protein [Pirellulales bacterium]